MSDEKFPLIEVDLDDGAEDALKELMRWWVIDHVSQAVVDQFLGNDLDKASMDDYFSLVGEAVVMDAFFKKVPEKTIKDIIENSDELTKKITDVLNEWANETLQPASKYQFDLFMAKSDLTPEAVERDVGLCVMNEIILNAIQEAINREAMKAFLGDEKAKKIFEGTDLSKFVEKELNEKARD